MRVNCLAQEHNAVPWPGLEPRPIDPEFSSLTIWPPRLARLHDVQNKIFWFSQLFFYPLYTHFNFSRKCYNLEISKLQGWRWGGGEDIFSFSPSTGSKFAVSAQFYYSRGVQSMDWLATPVAESPGAPRGVLPTILDRGVPQRFLNPDPI